MMIFLDQKTPVGLGEGAEESRGAHKPLGRALGGRLPGLWTPRESPNPNSCSINSKIFPNQQKRPPKYFSAATSLCSCEIPSRDLFRRPARVGFDHGGLLHQRHSFFDDV